MPKLYRDATIGQFTKSDWGAAARPGETVAEAVPARHEAPDLAELRRLAEAATPGPWAARYGVSWEACVCATTGSLADVDSTANAELIAAAVNALPSLLGKADALLDAAAERDALMVAQPCVMRMGEVYDFAWCETHDRTFALGSSCDHAGLSHVDYLDALAAKVERVRALHFGEYVEDEDQNRCFECGDDWPCPTIRALDEEPQQ